jgi:hypothetical protein
MGITKCAWLEYFMWDDSKMDLHRNTLCRRTGCETDKLDGMNSFN